jgi:hypothetical protein
VSCALLKVQARQRGFVAAGAVAVPLVERGQRAEVHAGAVPAVQARRPAFEQSLEVALVVGDVLGERRRGPHRDAPDVTVGRHRAPQVRRAAVVGLEGDRRGQLDAVVEEGLDPLLGHVGAQPSKRAHQMPGPRRGDRERDRRGLLGRDRLHEAAEGEVAKARHRADAHQATDPAGIDEVEGRAGERRRAGAAADAALAGEDELGRHQGRRAARAGAVAVDAPDPGAGGGRGAGELGLVDANLEVGGVGVVETRGDQRPGAKDDDAREGGETGHGRPYSIRRASPGPRSDVNSTAPASRICSRARSLLNRRTGGATVAGAVARR